MFHSARIKLTLWYLLIIMVISISFSEVIYHFVIREVDRFVVAQKFRIERRLQQGFIPAPENFIFVDPDLVLEVKKRVAITLVFINVGILVAAGGLGYWLAGRTLQPIKHMVDEQHRFVADASHELRTPLTALKSTMEVHLRDKNLTLKEAKILIQQNIEDVNKLQSLSDSLLQLAQFETLQKFGDLEKFSLKSVILNMIKQLEPLSKAKSIEIKYDLDETEIEGRKLAITDLFVILVDNAIKYSPQQTEIFIQSKKRENYVLISILDQGIGIAKRDLHHIFDRFYRADTARTSREKSGYGLGLSIAKKIVDQHKGTISVKSTQNKGSLFTVKLPLKHT